MDWLKPYKSASTGSSYFDGWSYLIPRKCPHCLHSISVNLIDRKQQNYSRQHHVDFLLHSCPECAKNFLSVHCRNVVSKTTEFLYCYPSHIKHQHTTPITKHFPRFIEVYDQAYLAEQMNHFTIAGAGYRIALEILVKDYASLIHPASEEKIKTKMTLNNCIQEYYKDTEAFVPADVVRKLGNDFSHYSQKFEEVAFTEIKTYLDIFVKNIEMKLKLYDPPVPVQRN